MAQGQHTLAGLDAEAATPGVLPDGQTRLRALAKAVNDQVRDIEAVVSPALGGPLPPAAGSKVEWALTFVATKVGEPGLQD